METLSNNVLEALEILKQGEKCFISTLNEKDFSSIAVVCFKIGIQLKGGNHKSFGVHGAFIELKNNQDMKTLAKGLAVYKTENTKI